MYQLQTFRNMPYNAEMPISFLFFAYGQLVRDSEKHRIDPFQIKFIGKPTKSLRS